MAKSFKFRPAGFDDFDDEYDDDGFVFGGEEFDSDEETPRGSNNHASQYSSAPTGSGGFGVPQGRAASNGWSFQQSAHSREQQKQPQQLARKKLVHRKQPPRKAAGEMATEETGTGTGTQNENIPEVIPVDDFRLAVIKNDGELVKRFLQQGMDVDVVFSSGWTSLIYAASCGHPDIVAVLLEHGADVHAHKDLYTVLMAACASTKDPEVNVLQCVNLLLGKGADVSTFDRYHMSPLMYAAREGRATVVQRLIEAGADLNKQDTKGYTALMWAVTRGQLRVVQTLLAGGADVKQKSSDGSTAVDMAMLRGQSQIQDILAKYADPSQKELLVSTSDLVNDLDLAREAPPSDVVPESKSKTSALVNSATQGYMKYGDLELFLSGLELGNLIPRFQENHMTFSDFLRVTDADLQQMGISQLGVRKKIIDAIQQTHKREWETSSLTALQYNKQISCAEAVAMLANIKKHARYIGSTIGFLTEQIQTDDTVVSNKQDGAGMEELCVQTEEAMTNVRLLYHDLVTMRTHLSQLSKAGNYKPADLIAARKHGLSRRKALPVAAAGLIVCALLVWKGPVMVETLGNIVHSVRS